MDVMQVKTLERQIAQWKWGVAIVAVALVSAYVGYFFGVLKQPLAENADQWGAFGDFIGGLLNPLVAFAAFYWLTQSVKLQKQELSETRQALEEAAQAQQETALAQQKAVDIQRQTADSLQETARAQMDAANAQRESAVNSALLLKASIHEVLMRYELEKKKDVQDSFRELRDELRAVGVSRSRFEEELGESLPQINARISEHENNAKKHMAALDAILEVIPPTKGRA